MICELHRFAICNQKSEILIWKSKSNDQYFEIYSTVQKFFCKDPNKFLSKNVSKDIYKSYCEKQ